MIIPDATILAPLLDLKEPKSKIPAEIFSSGTYESHLCLICFRSVKSCMWIKHTDFMSRNYWGHSEMMLKRSRFTQLLVKWAGSLFYLTWIDLTNSFEPEAELLMIFRVTSFSGRSAFTDKVARNLWSILISSTAVSWRHPLMGIYVYGSSESWLFARCQCSMGRCWETHWFSPWGPCQTIAQLKLQTFETLGFQISWDYGKLAMHRHIKSEIKKRNFEALRLKDGWNTPFDTALWRGKWSANPFILSKELWHPIDFTKPRHLRPWLRLQWLQRGSLKQPQPKIRWWLPTCCDSTPKVSHGAPSDALVPTRT